MKAELPIIAFATPAAWNKWLKTNHDTSPGVWVKLAKKGNDAASIDYQQALEGALIWGWIDGQKGPVDDAWWVQKFTKRGAKSIWSQINCKKIEALIAANKMQPPGLAAVAAAKADGRWGKAYASPKGIAVPDDLAAALAKYPKAKAFFDTLNAANRYAFLFRVHTAKKPETRTRHIERCVEMCRKGEKLHP